MSTVILVLAYVLGVCAYTAALTMKRDEREDPLWSYAIEIAMWPACVLFAIAVALLAKTMRSPS